MGYRGYSELRRGLVLHLPMSEGAGTVVRDTSQYRNNGVFGVAGAAPSWVEGREGRRAISFDGVDDYIAVPNDDSLNIIGEMSISFWAYFASAFDGGDVLSKQTNGALSYSAFRGYKIGCDGSGMKFRLGDGGGSYDSNYVSITLDAWTHWLGVYDGNNLILSKDTISSINEVGAVVQSYLNFNLYVGTGAWGYPKVIVNDLRIYNRALDATEGRNLFNLKGLI